MTEKEHCIGDNIARLRKEHGLTQAELAAQLNVSDKAVSKWENGNGDPNIDMFIPLAKLFGVSIDYLMTGKETEKDVLIMSRVEFCAKNDDVGLSKKLGFSIDTIDDGGTLLDYIYKYESCKLFEMFLPTLMQCYADPRFRNNRGNSRQLEPSFLFMLLITNNIKELDSCHIWNSRYKRTFNCIEELSKLDEKLLNAILYDKRISEVTRKSILDPTEFLVEQNRRSYVNELYPVLYNLAYQKKDGIMAENLLRDIEQFNSDSRDAVRLGTNNCGYGPQKCLAVCILEGTIRLALSRHDYNLVERLNNINAMSNGYVVSEYDIKMEKVNSDPTLSEKDRRMQYVLHEGILCVKELVAFDDYDFYHEMITKYPISECERLQEYAKAKTYKPIFDWAMKNEYRELVSAFQADDTEHLCQKIADAFIKARSEAEKYGRHSKLNAELNLEYVLDKYYTPALPKAYLIFEWIKNHNDIRFFEHFAKQWENDTQNYGYTGLDDALVWILQNRPESYKIQKALLDGGAVLHKYWQEDDGEGYIDRECADISGTQILKNQIQILLREKK